MIEIIIKNNSNNNWTPPIIGMIIMIKIEIVRNDKK